MIPIASTLYIRHRPRGLPIWIPLFLVWLFLLPFVVLVSPLVFIACVAVGVNPFRAFAVLWRIISNLKGTDVQVQDGACSVSVRIPRRFL